MHCNVVVVIVEINFNKKKRLYNIIKYTLNEVYNNEKLYAGTQVT